MGMARVTWPTFRFWGSYHISTVGRSAFRWRR